MARKVRNYTFMPSKPLEGHYGTELGVLELGTIGHVMLMSRSKPKRSKFVDLLSIDEINELGTRIARALNLVEELAAMPVEPHCVPITASLHLRDIIGRADRIKRGVA